MADPQDTNQPASAEASPVVEAPVQAETSPSSESDHLDEIRQKLEALTEEIDAVVVQIQQFENTIQLAVEIEDDAKRLEALRASVDSTEEGAPGIEKDVDSTTGKEGERQSLSNKLEQLESQKNQLEQEQKIEQMHLSRDQIVEKMTAKIEKEFPAEEFPYHNIEHSKRITTETSTVLKLIQEIDPELVSNEDLVVAEIEAIMHDDPQSFSVDEKTIARSRVRQRGFNPEWINPADRPDSYEDVVGNEQAAADNIVTELQSEGHDGVFDEIPADEVHYDVASTYPDVAMIELPDDICPDHLKGQRVFTMQQPYAREAGVRGVALSLADIPAGYGIKDPENPRSGIDAGNTEFQELMMGLSEDIVEAASSDEGLQSIDSKKRAAFTTQMLSWLRSQDGFFLGQQVNMNRTLDENPTINGSSKSEEIKTAIRERYSDFSEVAADVREEYEKANALFGLTNQQDREAQINAELQPANTIDQARTDELKTEKDAIDLEVAKALQDDPDAEKFTELCKIMGYNV